MVGYWAPPRLECQNLLGLLSLLSLLGLLGLLVPVSADGVR